MKCVILIIECWHSRGTWTHGALRQVIKEFFRGFTITFPFTVKRYTPDMRGHHILALLSFLVGKTYFLYGMPRNYSEFMSEELKNKEVLKNKKSLLVQGSLSDNKLIESLKSFSNTEKIISYSTELVNKKYSDLEKITKKYNTYVVFTSPSSFDSFIKFYDASKVNLVSIGNTTSSYITNLGFQTILTSKMQSYEGISESLIAFFNENKQHELSKN